jgi:outer membrane protein OmpA-like peptidoglycan-associated protein
LNLSISGFSSKEFLTLGIEEKFSRGDLSVAYTPLDFLEVYAGMRSLSYTNPLSSPNYIQGQGDVKFGAKVGRFWGVLGVGLATGVQMLSDPQGGGWKGDATSVDVHALFTADLTRKKRPVPFRFHMDVHFTKENSEALTADLDGEPSLVQEWGYQSGRYDRLMLNFGVEAPTRYVSPFVSYHIGTPFLVEMPRMGQYSRVFAFESVPHFIAGGLRGFALPEVAIEVGGTLGVSDAPFTGVPATPPWTIWGGVTYTLDPRPKVIEREVKIKPPPPPKPEPPKPLGTMIKIQVVSAQDQSSIVGAKLSFVGAPLSALVSDDQGMFSGYRLAPKKYVIEVSAPGYISRKLRLSIKKGREELKAKLKLKPDPQGTQGRLEVKWSPQDPTAATQLELTLFGPETHKASLTANTPFKIKLKPGEYVLIVKDTSGKRYQDVITLGGNGEAIREIKPEMLTASGVSNEAGSDDADAPQKTKSKLPLKGSTKWIKYNLKRKRLSTKVAVGFIGEGAKLNKGSKRAVKGLADYLNREPRVSKIVVMVHTHSRGNPRADKKLGYRRGQAIKKLLASEGVSASRVAVYSYGSEKNVASNMSRRGRQRNQRVSLRIKSVDL